jgi:hypothetical protein
MGVKLRGRDIRMAQQFLNSANVIAAFEQMGREAVTPMPRSV